MTHKITYFSWQPEIFLPSGLAILLCLLFFPPSVPETVAHKARCRVEKREESKYITKNLKDECDECLSAGNEGAKLQAGRNELELLPSPPCHLYLL